MSASHFQRTTAEPAGFDSNETVKDQQIVNAVRAGLKMRTEAGEVMKRMLLHVFTVFSVLLVVAAGLLVPQNPFSPLPEAAAQEQPTPSTSYKFGDCSFRKGTGQAEALANQLCFLDWTGFSLERPSGGTVNYGTRDVTKKIGRYTLTFTMTIGSERTGYPRVVGTNSPSFEPEKAVFNSVRNDGTTVNQYFTANAGDTSMPILDYANVALFNERTAYLNLLNIQVRDEKNNLVPDYTFAVMDAQNTFAGSPGEAITVNNAEGDVTRLQRITPEGFVLACTHDTTGGTYGPGTIPGNWNNTAAAKDFVCLPPGSGGVTTLSRKSPGTFAVAATNPKNLELGIFTSSTGYQALTLALNVGRVGGSLKSVNTAFEQRATGQATSFNFQAFDRLNGVDTQIPLVNGQYTAQLRKTGTDGKAQDSYVFRSTASGAQADLALARYNPVWTCTVGQNSTYTIKDGSTAAGFTLSNTASSSELVFPNPDNLPVNCQVAWEPRFELSSLHLSKQVTGTASTYSDVESRKFRLVYECTNYNNFAAGYPLIPLTGSATLANGGFQNVENLPKGMQCTIHEEFPDGNPASGPGVTHSLAWDGGTQVNGAMPSTSVTLGDATARRADNLYNSRTGTLILSKELAGLPVGEFPQSRQYQFEVSCTGTNFRGVVTTMTVTRTGTAANGQVVVDNVPVGRDCTVKPLTGLSSEDSQKYRLDGRVVTWQGQRVEATAEGAYPFKLADYPAGTPPTSGDMHIVANYSYQTRNVSILKELRGPAAGNPELLGTVFRYNYRCTWGGDNPQEKSGTVETVTTIDEDIAIIEAIPVGASCTMYEQDPQSFVNVEFDRAELSHADAADQVTTLSNAAARTTPILSVGTSTDPAENRVVVTNYFNPRLGTVDVAKVVEDSGIGVELPNNFSFTFRCGSRTIVQPDGSTRSVPLNGTFSVTGGSSTELVLNSTSAADNAAVNDQGGSLGVPYGNECTFTEDTPDAGSYPGVLWETDATEQRVSISAPTTTVTVTNTFEPLGEGLTVSQQTTAGATLSRPVAYTLTCTDPLGAPVDLGADGTFELSEQNPTHTVPAASLPEGSECSLAESGSDSGVRDKPSGGTFPVDRDSTVTYAQDASSVPENASFDNLAPVLLNNFEIGSASAVTVGHAYRYIQADISAEKVVAFDPATVNYISAERQNIKRDRNFHVTLLCTEPLGNNTFSAQGQVSSTTGELDLGSVAEGSDCSTAELSTTSAAGIDVLQEVSVNGSARSIRTQDFSAAAENNIVFTNTYSRRLADVKLDKIAQLPGNIQQQYEQAGQDIQFHTHNFVLECHDLATGVGDDGALLGQFSRTIYGPGDTVFNDIPVGSDCTIQGDQFGELDLSLTDEDDTQLQAQLRPTQVRWVVDSNDGDSYTDTEIPGGTTTSQYFVVRDDNPNDNEGGTSYSNAVDLVNTYDYVNTQITMTKDVVGRDGDLALLPDDFSFNFTLQCRGVGYQYSTIGTGENVLDPSLDMSQFGALTQGQDGNSIRSYQGPDATVPVGAWCTFSEIPASGLPVELTNTVNETTIAKRASDTEDGPVESWDFVNNIERRTTPVSVPVVQGGYTSVANPDGYTVTFTCNDPAETSVTTVVPTSQALTGLSVATSQSPGESFIAWLPVGADCVMDLHDSPALAADPALEVTAGDRQPFSQFNHWISGAAQNAAVTKPLSEYSADDVTGSMKQYTYEFAVPGDLSSTQSQLSVGAATYFMVDRVDVAFTKNSVGAAGEDATFTFASNCAAGSGTQDLTGGQTWVLHDVPVDSSCAVSETSDGVAESNSVLALESAGEGITDIVVNNTPADADIPEAENSRSIAFMVRPASSSADLSADGPQWSLSAVNRFPGVSVTKTIAGSPLSAVTGAVADTAVLADGATVMDVTYRVDNDGAFDFTDLTLTDPSLAGQTVVDAEGNPIGTIGSDGSIDPTLCSVAGTALAAEQTVECTISVAIWTAPGEYFSYRGEVTATATAAEGVGTISDTDSYGALRLSDTFGWMLPDTGMQTLVWLLLLGLTALAIGVWRYLSGRREEEEADELD